MNDLCHSFFYFFLIIIFLVGDRLKEKFLNSSIKIINNNREYSDEQMEIITYGLEAIYLTVTKMIVIFSLAYFLGIIKEVLTLLIAYNIIRSQAFGLHATKSSYCLFFSLIVFVGGAIFCKIVIIPKIIMIIGALICDICLFIYAPADTYKRPLINAKKRKRFKILSTLFGIIYTILICSIDNYLIISYLFLGMVISVLMILPITYKVFGLPYNNYKNYNYGV